MSDSSVQPKLVLDPRTKFLFLLVANVVAFTHSPRPFLLWIFTSCALILWVTTRRWLSLIILSLLVSLLAVIQIPGLNESGAIIGYFGQRYLVVGMLIGWFFTTTSSADLIYAVQKVRFPTAVWVPLAVMFRFFPKVQEIAINLSDTLRLRGLWSGPVTIFCHPIRTVRLFLIPLINQCLRAADQLSAAVLTRGLGYSKQRSSYRQTRLGIYDYLVLTLVGATIIAFLWLE